MQSIEKIFATSLEIDRDEAVKVLTTARSEGIRALGDRYSGESGLGHFLGPFVRGKVDPEPLQRYLDAQPPTLLGMFSWFLINGHSPKLFSYVLGLQGVVRPCDSGNLHTFNEIARAIGEPLVDALNGNWDLEEVPLALKVCSDDEFAIIKALFANNPRLWELVYGEYEFMGPVRSEDAQASFDHLNFGELVGRS